MTSHLRRRLQTSFINDNFIWIVAVAGIVIILIFLGIVGYCYYKSNEAINQQKHENIIDEEAKMDTAKESKQRKRFVDLSAEENKDATLPTSTAARAARARKMSITGNPPSKDEATTSPPLPRDRSSRRNPSESPSRPKSKRERAVGQDDSVEFVENPQRQSTKRSASKSPAKSAASKTGKAEKNPPPSALYPATPAVVEATATIQEEKLLTKSRPVVKPRRRSSVTAKFTDEDRPPSRPVSGVGAPPPPPGRPSQVGAPPPPPGRPSQTGPPPPPPSRDYI